MLHQRFTRLRVLSSWSFILPVSASTLSPSRGVLQDVATIQCARYETGKKGGRKTHTGTAVTRSIRALDGGQ
jgi:hypothetical protein